MQKLDLCATNSIFYVSDIQSEDAGKIKVETKVYVVAFFPPVVFINTSA